MKFNWFQKLGRRQCDEELDAEIRTHLDAAIRDRIARGETPDEARANRKATSPRSGARPTTIARRGITS